ncbi:MAG TPA: hypothetical protein VGH90_04265, partial [Chthoniobacteraceae bacterium]
MPEGGSREENQSDRERENATREAAAALRKAAARVRTPKDAEKVIDQVTRAADGKTEREVAEAAPAG